MSFSTASPGWTLIVIDTHVHFDEVLRVATLQSVLDRALAQDVRVMIAVGGSPESNRQAMDLARAHPERIKAAVAYGRDQVGRENPVDELTSLLKTPGTVAVGETGLDLYYDRQTKDAQLVLFEQMLETARVHRLPVIVHSREAEDMTIAILNEHVRNWKGRSSGPGVLHCFTGSQAFARRLLDLGFFISFSGILTFKNANALREAARMVPDDRVLMETDSPYVAPEPHRGKRNEPAFVRHVAKVLADIRHCSFEDMVSLTTRNAERLFHEETHGHRH